MKEQEYFVSFLDILGFKEYFESPNTELEKIYCSLLRILKDLPQTYLTGMATKSYTPASHSGPVASTVFNISVHIQKVLTNTYHFSDSIVFFIEASESEEDNVERLKAISWVSNLFISKAILYDASGRTFDFPLRGAIAYGKAIVDRNNRVHVGEPFVNAYELAEAQEWMGGAIHPSVPKRYVGILAGYDNEIYEYDIPLKKKYKKDQKKKGKNLPKYSLNWVKHHPSLKKWVKNLQREGPTYNDIGLAHVGAHKWGRETKKKKNTLTFVKRICDEYDRSVNREGRNHSRKPC